MTQLVADENKAVVARFFEIFSSGDVPALLNAMADDGGWWVSGKLEGMSGRYDKASFGPLVEGAKAIYKSGSLTITPVSMIAEGDKVAVEATGFAELTDGRTYEPQYHFLVSVRDGKVCEVREYMDTQHAKDTFFG
ncbi:nuclear transport factor 2 family protein [Novosphingobium sp. MMS21-SN21R]|uniref:nuclear transport factor 2 family protein n=1 Tax=Novosphingobium sp. MMS21-SN21R TaxID=2969298 RepID=UPI002887D743|nr:nuclear transport factor 2 family protein [Novosphingobium sp. MMS21-SN21R]MDT0507915.1 nuclear transport factor 2 family protein [Novosphingobium sp. MMS21-SN21R]